MPDFWQFPTVSMGLGPIMSIYQARFMTLPAGARTSPTRADRKVWAFLGDGEMDEPESLGAISLAGAREARQPDLGRQLQPAAPRRSGARQRQDHPGARGRLPRRRLERHQGDLGRPLGPAARAPTRAARSCSVMDECVDGEYQTFKSRDGAYVREHFFGRYPETARAGRGHGPTTRSGRSTAAATIRRRSTPPTPRRSSTRGAADRHPRQDDQGLRDGRSRRGPERSRTRPRR